MEQSNQKLYLEIVRHISAASEGQVIARAGNYNHLADSICMKEVKGLVSTFLPGSSGENEGFKAVIAVLTPLFEPISS